MLATAQNNDRWPTTIACATTVLAGKSSDVTVWHAMRQSVERMVQLEIGAKKHAVVSHIQYYPVYSMLTLELL